MSNIVAEVKFSKIFGECNYSSNTNKIVKDNEDNYYVLSTEVEETGQSLSKGYLAIRKFDENGEMIFEKDKILNSVSTSFEAPIGSDMAIDDLGNIYITGFVKSNVYKEEKTSSIYSITPTNILETTKEAVQKKANGFIDGFVMKFNKNGEVIYSTFLGGPEVTSFAIADMGPITIALGIAVDSNYNMWITGATDRSDFYITKDAVQGRFKGGIYDGFITKINESGTEILYSTFLGGGYDDLGLAIAIDKKDNVIVVGENEAEIFPGGMMYGSRNIFYTLNAYQKKAVRSALSSGFITKLDNKGKGIFSTYFGGEIDENMITTIAINSKNEILVGGMTGGDFPITDDAFLDYAENDDNYYIGFISKFTEDGKLIASSYIGGNNDYINKNPNIFFLSPNILTRKYFIRPEMKLESKSYEGVVKALDIDKEDNIWVVGETVSIDFPVTDNAIQFEKGQEADAFVAKVDSNLSNIIYGTYFGGVKDDAGSSIVIDNKGSICLVGQTSSDDFPSTFGCSDALLQGSSFILKLKEKECNYSNCFNLGDKNNYTTGPISSNNAKNRMLIILENKGKEDATITIKFRNLKCMGIFREHECFVKSGSSRRVIFNIVEMHYEVIFEDVPLNVYLFCDADYKVNMYCSKDIELGKPYVFYHNDLTKE